MTSSGDPTAYRDRQRRGRGKSGGGWEWHRARQRSTPWGEVRDGNHTVTSIDVTGQRRDDSGLLFYNACSYDPKLARFLSADTVVPGNASGGMDGVAYRPLTVAFHEAGFAQ